MYINEMCASCGQKTIFKRIQRSLIERVVHAKYYKLQCTNCSAKILFHRSRREIKTL